MIPIFNRTKSKKDDPSTSNKKLLLVKVIEAKGLKALGKSKGTPTCDPYGVICLRDMADREVNNESFKISPKPGTLTPKWSESFTFGNMYDLSYNQYRELPRLQVRLYHKGQHDFSETPLGIIDIDLNTINSKEINQWYPLMPDGRATDVCGEVKLSLRFNKDDAPHEDTEADDSTNLLPGVSQDEVAVEINDDYEGTVDPYPNMLVIKLNSARNLPAVDTSLISRVKTSDPIVRFSINGYKSQESSVIEKNINPNWNESFTFNKLTDASLSLEVTVEDYNNFTTRTFLGKVVLPLHQFADMTPIQKTYKLLDKHGNNDGKDHGELSLNIQWKFDMKTDSQIREDKLKAKSSLSGKLSKFTSKLTGREEDESEDDGNATIEGDEEETKPLSEEEKNKQKEDEKAKQKELAEIDIKTGDYQVVVHIIEARDLKAENFDGTSDPIVYAECMGQKQHTKVIQNVTNCVFDDLMIFNYKDLDKEAFNEGCIRISVYDSSFIPGAMKTMIGAFSIDAAQVYTMNKDHEYYRQWVPLMDDEDAGDTGVQGYLKITIQIIGPGEKIKVHDEEAELAAEMARESKAGDDVSSLIGSVPMIRREWVFLVVSVYRLEGLPIMDGKVGVGALTISQAKTDAFCKFNFAGGKPIKTPVITVTGNTRQAMVPTFNVDLWYPVSIPTMTQMAKLSVFDHDLKGSELIGTIMEKYKAIDSNGRHLPLKWYNMYGAPENKQASVVENLKKVGKAVDDLANQVVAGGIDYYELYNSVPDRASSYKGRALLQFRIETPEKRPVKYRTSDIKPFRRKLKALSPKTEPPTANYILQAAVYNGSDLPAFSKLVGKQEMRVVISIGPIELSTKSAKYEHGLCRWNDFLKTETLVLPKDINQIPDIFVYLVNGDNKYVTFGRIKPADKQGNLYGFSRAAEWVLLQEDKSINALEDDTFPGNILIRLGFGYEVDAQAAETEWKDALEKSKKMASYQMRVHVFQGSELPAADSNGACDPFLKLYFMGKDAKTSVKNATLFPAYYETLVFDDVGIASYDNFRYAPQLTFRLYDEDRVAGLKSGREYLGTFGFNLSDAFITEDLNLINDTKLFPDPKWYNFFKEVPNDGQGKLLVSVQLIPRVDRVVPTKPLPSIKPETKQAFIQLLALGLRNLAPFNFQAMQAPFLELELNSFGTSFSTTTAISKKPDPSNPNFLEKLEMAVELPVKSIYATPLQLRVRDTRLGGYSKPIVGMGVVDLSTKLPWSENYIAPQTEVFLPPGAEPLSVEGGEETGPLPGVNTDPIALLAGVELSNRKAITANPAINPSTVPVMNLDTYVAARKLQEDTGAGIFGALNHIKRQTPSTQMKPKKKIFKFDQLDFDTFDDDDLAPPEWKVGRKVLEAELEGEYKTSPFETYNLTRGKANIKSIFAVNKIKSVGIFKGIVRVKEFKHDPDVFSETLMSYFQKPKQYKLRLYVLRGLKLAEMDTDIFGKKVASDPYLRVSLGKNIFNDRVNAVDKAIDVDFYKMIEMDCELPGTSQLTITVMDKDTIGSDDPIGKTIIDLEDRWFDSRWQNEGRENRKLPGEDKSKPNAIRWDTKPIERRTLYLPSSKQSQGVVECYLDIMRPEEAIAFPPDDITLPPKQTFEMRIVIWKTKNVPAMDSIEKMSDLFVKVWPEGSKPQETDTHWRCKKGKASFNWRLLFDVELGHNTRLMKFPYLHVQLWDRDILKWNDCAGECIINIGKYISKAYKKNTPIKLFEKPKGAMAKRQEKARMEERLNPKLLDTDLDIPKDEESGTGVPAINQPVSSTTTDSPVKSPMAVTTNPDIDSDDEDDIGLGAIPRNSIAVATPNRTASTSLFSKTAVKSVGEDTTPTAAVGKDNQKGKEAVEPKKKSSSWFGWGKSDEEEEDEEAEEEAPLIEEGKDDDEDDEGEMKELISSIKSMTGLWEDEDPPDSSWLDLEQKDHNTGKVTPMGSICYSIQIWPKDKALAMPVGAARNEPNTNPFLPPPVGRLKFSWNPFVLGSELCGPTLCAQLFCCLLCIAMVLIMVFAQPFLTLLINVVFFFG